MWLKSDILEKHGTNINNNLKFRVWKHDMPCALEKIIMAELSGHISKYVNFIKCVSGLKLNLIHSNQHLPQGRDFTRMLLIFLWWKFNLIHAYQHSQHPKKHKNRNSETTRGKVSNRRFKAVQGSNRSKGTEIEVINKDVWRKRKEKVFNRRNWLIHNAKLN